MKGKGLKTTISKVVFVATIGIDRFGSREIGEFMVVGFSQRIVLSRFLGMLSDLEPGALLN